MFCAILFIPNPEQVNVYNGALQGRFSESTSNEAPYIIPPSQ
jgi:hypothetical protein